MSMLDRISNLLFPPVCVNCGDTTAWLCTACELLWPKYLRTSIETYPTQELPIFIAAKDDLEVVSKLLFAWKYQRYYQAGEPLQQLWTDAFVRTFFTTQDTILVPVPMHWFKQWQRGFNQAEQLVKIVKKTWHIPCVALLKRQRYTITQVGLDKGQRQTNIHAAFKLNEKLTKKLSKDCLIVLVDDIVTTGTTLRECSQVLHQAGFHHIVALVLQRGTR